MSALWGPEISRDSGIFVPRYIGLLKNCRLKSVLLLSALHVCILQATCTSTGKSIKTVSTASRHLQLN